MVILRLSVTALENPDLARERAGAGRKEDVKPWGRILMPLMSIFGNFRICRVDAGFIEELNIKRFLKELA